MSIFKKLNEKLKANISQILMITSFVIYILIFIWLLFFKFNNQEIMDRAYDIMVTEGRTLYEKFMYQFWHPHHYENWHGWVEDSVNIILFIPLGIYLPFLFKKRNYWRDVAITSISVLVIETIQLFTSLGWFEFYDLLLNVIGMSIGYLLYRYWIGNFKPIAVNYITLFVTVTCTPITIFAIVNTILHFDLYLRFFTY